jgi:hypothetical protein
VFGAWTEYTASDVGFPGEQFVGESWWIGGEVATTIYQDRELFIDLFAGARWENVQVDNEFINTQGEDDLFLPVIGARVENYTDVARTFAAASVEFTVSAISGAEQSDLTELGRFAPDEDWVVLHWDMGHSFFVEPLLDPAWSDPDAPGTKLAHEIAVSFKGQYAFNYRLIPQAEQVAGGLYTVRGYPEAVAAGDTVLVGSLEYRFHLPRALYERQQVRSQPTRLFGEPFRFAPTQPYGTADWDLIFKAFVDAGRTIISEPFFFESDETLVGAGIGVEFLFKRNLSARVDWGFVLNEIPVFGVESGDDRVHFVVTLVY